MQEMIQARTQYVVKANELIQKSRFSLSTQQQKIILFLISRISPYDEDFKEYEFSVQDFCRVCGLNCKSGYYYSELKKLLKEISDQSFYVTMTKEDGEHETLVRWIESPEIINKRVIKVTLNKTMKPLLLQLKEHYTQYELIWTLKFKSKYSIRLYEFIKSLHFKELEEYQTRVFSLDELKERLDAETYKEWQGFRRRVLLVAIDEINRYSDKIVEYVPMIEDKKIIGISFKIKTKDIIERDELYYNISEELGFNQMMIEGY